MSEIAFPPKEKHRSDAELCQDVRDQLFWNFWVDSDNVKVKVRDGVVILKGTVEDWPAYIAALQSARAAKPEQIRDRLHIANPPRYENAQVNVQPPATASNR